MRCVVGVERERWLTNLCASEASQLIEFAVILPLLIVIIVGIYDFSQAFNLKQKLANASFQGAQLGSIQPTTDLTLPSPLTVSAIRDVVDTSLARAGISDCGLSAIGAGPSNLSWTASGTCVSGSFTLTIERGYTFQVTVSGVPSKVNVVSTRVTISYPYAWQFNNVIKLLVPAGNYTPPLLTTIATVPNQD